jgi:hypothetical protein
VTVFKNNTNGLQIAGLTAPGNFTWSTQELLGPRDRLIVVAAGITGVVQFEVVAIEIATAWLPEYLL